MKAKKSTPYLIRTLIVVVALGLIPFLKPGTTKDNNNVESRPQEVVTKNEIVIQTDEAGRVQILNKIISFREKYPKVGIVVVLDDRALTGNGPDICMIDPNSNRYSQLGKCFINDEKQNDRLILDFAETINAN